jgi:glucosamine-6-phosphate deaminase
METRQDNGADFNGLAPGKALTQGVGTILGAKKLLLIARGAAKAHSIKSLLEGEVVPTVPVTYLRDHQNLTVFVDEAAMALVENPFDTRSGQ